MEQPLSIDIVVSVPTQVPVIISNLIQSTSAAGGDHETAGPLSSGDGQGRGATVSSPSPHPSHSTRHFVDVCGVRICNNATHPR
eukprot:m.270023 g.270023  ORF g.270023 m.270023 type:complete len:84 (+) comp16072_c0_seq4:204-455(+)